jgi:uncharacterized protein YgiM (DUF1202 family)
MKRCRRRTLFRNTLLLALAAFLLMTALPAAQAATTKVLYEAYITQYFPNSVTNVYAKPDVNSAVLANYNPGQAVQIVAVEPNFVGILLGNKTAWVLRHRIMEPVAVDFRNTPRFGTVFNQYFATADHEIAVKAGPGQDSETLITLRKGAQIGFLDVTDGWARTIFKRQYGYVDTRTLPELLMVAPREEAGTDDVPIAVYNSFYDVSDSENNINRINNLVVGGKRMSRTLGPGESLDFNRQVGPFQGRNGYMPAGALVDGELVYDVYGGGSCQVSSTLYNVVLQLNGLTVIRRAPHGANGAKYLPHGVDASSGGLNFIFRNDYPFPVSIKAHVQDGSLFIAIYKAS